MIISKIAQRIQSDYSHGVQSEDSRLSYRHIYNKMVTVRARLLSQQAKKNQMVNHWNFQTLDCIELIVVSSSMAPCVAPEGHIILKSKQKIPTPLSDFNKHLMNFSTLDGYKTFDILQWQDVKYRGGTKYIAKRPFIFILNGYLYLVFNRTIDGIAMTAVFGDPIEAQNFPCFCCNTANEYDCIPYYDRDFPIDEELIEALVEISREELVKEFTATKADDISNAKEDK